MKPALWTQLPGAKVSVKRPRKPLKRSQKPIRRATPERARQLREYEKIRRTFLHGRFCERHWKREVTSVVPTEVHHRRGRRGEMLLKTEYWSALCRECHAWVHANPAKAKEEGWFS